MDQDRLIEELKTILEADELDSNSKLDDFEMWDSFARLHILTFLEDEGFTSLSDEELAKVETPQSIMEFLG